MAKSGSITITQGTQEIVNNRTYITVSGVITTTGESYRGNTRTGNISVTQNGAAIYNGDFTHGAPANSTTTLFSVGLWVNHDSNGNSGTISASYNYDGGWCTASASTTLTTIPRRAEITSAPDFTNVDNPIITYNNPAGFRVDTWLEINPTNTHLCIRENIGSGGSYTYVLTGAEREELIRCCTKDTATIRFGMYTYNGATLIGTHYVDKTFSLSKDIIPTASVALSDAEGHLDKYGKFIQGQSKLHVSITAEGVYGSTIKSYKTTFDGKTYTDAKFTTDAITGKDTLDLEVVVTDSRGRSCTVKESIEVYEYNQPKITSIKAKRCQEHNVNELGNDYLGVVFNSEVTSLDSQNSVTYELDYKKVTEEKYTTLSLSDYTNMHKVEGFAIFAADNDAYSIILRITDDFGTVEKKTNGPSISVLVSKLKYNLGIAFGKLAELVGVFDIGFKTRFSGGILQPVLEEGSDFHEQLIPNTYTLKDISTANYVNCPVAEGTGSLKVEECGENSYHLVLRILNKHHLVYECIYSQDEWSDWILTSGMQWKPCTLTANSNAGIFYNTPVACAYYRYDEIMLEIYITGTFVTQATITEETAFCMISGLDVEIPDGRNAPVWNDTGQKWINVNINKDGQVILSNDGSVGVNHWLVFSGVKFEILRK